jgi:hypothetical protein
VREVEGRVLGGLDEFMLRTGHLVTMVRAATDAGSSWRRIEKETAELLGTEVPITPELNGAVAGYLAEKELCAVSGKSRGKEQTYRYPDLEVAVGNDGSPVVKSIRGDAIPTIGWQDRNLSHPSVPSRVGAVTFAAKSGSKTGVSHIADWCQLLELLAANGQVRPSGRLLIALTGAARLPLREWNPYVIGPERLLIANEFLSKDFDIFSRLVPVLLGEAQPLTKADCRAAFMLALQQTVASAERSQSVGTRQRFELNQQLRDLERAAKKAETAVEETSTAWHRAASRVETLVDLGLLQKGLRNEREKYQYVYYPTERMSRVPATLSTSPSCEHWVNHHLVDILVVSDDSTQTPLPPQELIKDLAQIVQALSLPTSLLPVSTLAVGVAIVGAQRGRTTSLHEIRKQILNLPTTYPDIARLSRGRSGAEADFISLNVRLLNEALSG